MSIKTIFPLLAVILSISAAAQSDTTYWYWNKKGRITEKDSAFSYAKVYPTGKRWEKKEYWIEGSRLSFEGTYIDKDTKIADGALTFYKESGGIKRRSVYEKGKIQNTTYFHDNGNKKGFISYADNKQEGWDEAGNEIKNYIVEKAPKFPADWKDYIAANLKANTAAELGLPVGFYTVKVKFLVGKDGQISDVAAVEAPYDCPPCVVEAVRVVSNGPKCEPAILNQEIAVGTVIQPITFGVEEEVKQKKKRS